MTTPMPETAEVGELVEAAFDQAAQYATDPAEVSRLATRAVMNMLLRSRRAPAAASAPSPRNQTAGHAGRIPAERTQETSSN